MKRKIVIGLLALGTLVGFGSGIARMHHFRHGGRDRLMDQVAERCVDAARRLDRKAGRAPDRRAQEADSR